MRGLSCHVSSILRGARNIPNGCLLIIVEIDPPASKPPGLLQKASVLHIVLYFLRPLRASLQRWYQ